MKNIIIFIIAIASYSLLIFDAALATNFKNKLAKSSTPYLLQHAESPVYWHEWGDEAFEKARKKNKLIILNVGYSSCYWCYLMERQVFNNLDVAAMMNAHFINIKIDREERPDLDEFFMTATNISAERSGWPNNIIMTAGMEPLFAGTFFTLDEFLSILEMYSNDWRTRENVLRMDASGLRRKMSEIINARQKITTYVTLDQSIPENLFSFLKKNQDTEYGGFYSNVKFPHEYFLLFLLEYYKEKSPPEALDILKRSLDNMSLGGFYDHIGSGFHRYSSDRQWRIPHFEKMLYNQALLARIYAEFYIISENSLHKTIVEDTFSFVKRRMTGKNGEFFSSINSELYGIEGGYYTWRSSEILKILGGENFAFFTKLYGFSKISGNDAEIGKVIYLKKPLLEAAIEQETTYEHLSGNLNQIKAKLFEARNKRAFPLTDKKVITGWNGLMIDAYARAGKIFNNQDYIESAKNAALFIISKMVDEGGGLYRIFLKEKASQTAFFDDYAYFIQGLVSLYRATDDQFFLTTAKQFIEKADQLFFDKDNGGYFFNGKKTGLPLRLKDIKDRAIPSSNAIITHVFLDLYEITGDKGWLEKGKALLSAFSVKIKKSPSNYAHLTHAFLRLQMLNLN